MTDYNLQLLRSEYCIEMAAKQDDERLTTFWCNASAGFRERAKRIREGSK